MKVDYKIISRPDYILVECPHCSEPVKIPFDEIDYPTGLWLDGGSCICPECFKNIELGDYDYD